MKITKVTIRNFKRFKEETFALGDNFVVAGPNNCGKTTMLQAIATWSLALARWRELDNYHRRRGVYAKAPIARQAFYSVPLRAFDLLWNRRAWNEIIEIEVTVVSEQGISAVIPMEIAGDTSEQVYVRPRKTVDPKILQQLGALPQPVFVPAMTGLVTEEPVYQPAKIRQLLGQGKPGDVLRNLLVEAHHDPQSWERLTHSIKNIFGYELLPPNTLGPNIIAEYNHPEKNTFDIASAGSGFLQVLVLLTFLYSRKNRVLLLDEPDAHLHVILQDEIYTVLKAAARTSNSQLIIATHSEVVINSVDPRELCALIGGPKKLVDTNERASLIRSLSALSNMDIMLAREKQKILYVEGHTDLDILRAWAIRMQHRMQNFITEPFWKPSVSETRQQGKGVKAQDHFASLLLAQDDMRGVQISDRDGNPDLPAKKAAFDGRLLKLCWARYEIENYLVNPGTLTRFVHDAVGASAPLADIKNMKTEMRKHLPGAVVDSPLDDHDTLNDVKMRKSILPQILEAAGLSDFPYTRYAEIAAVMLPGEIHPEITEKLDAIADHFNL